MDFRLLEENEFILLGEIDRSEIVEEIYYFRNGELELANEYYDVKGWDLKELRGFIARLQDIYNRKGTIYGAFDNGKIVGLAALESKLIGKNKDQIKFDMLYISSSHRKRGISKKLISLLIEKAKELGAKKLYISATPSKNTVDFYLAIGAKVTGEIDDELYGLEPYDIHMELELG